MQLFLKSLKVGDRVACKGNHTRKTDKVDFCLYGTCIKISNDVLFIQWDKDASTIKRFPLDGDYSAVLQLGLRYFKLDPPDKILKEIIND